MTATSPSPSTPRRSRRVLTLMAALAVLTSFAPAHIVTEEPWHPVAAAYLRSLFHANLKPVPWDLIAAQYAEPLSDPGFEGRTVSELLEPAASVEGIDHRAAVRNAIAARDRGALFAASTRALSHLVRHHLAAAEAALDRPGAAQREVAAAKKIWRAFEQDVLEAVDPEAFRRIGVAWLELSSAAGNPGVMGVGRVDVRRDRFERARGVIETYLEANYESDTPTVRPRLVPLPESVSARTEVAPVAALDPFTPLSRRLPPGSNINDQRPLPLLRLNFEARGFDEADLFLVAYGDMLFDSPLVFGEPARSLGITCSTCHNRSDINKDFFVPGLSHQPGAVDVDGEFFNPRFNDQRRDPLDIPTLRGLRFTAPYGRDGRFSSLRDFARNVIVNEFGGDEPTPLMLDALVTYMLEFDWLPAPFLNPDGTLKEIAGDAALRGERIFNRPFEGLGGRACSTCHVPSANFIDRKSHDIRSGTPASPDSRDSSFDTPTLINALYTAPYFHDGSLATLADVVDWFDREHGLGLTAAERADLTEYLVAVGTADEPWELFDEENTPFALAWSELSTFLSTLRTLIPARDEVHALLLLQTVAEDLRLDVTMSPRPAAVAPRVWEIADKLDEIAAAIERDDWSAAARLHGEYERLAESHGPHLR